MPDLPKVDLVLADPPYLREYLWAYDLLCEIGSEKLKDSGFLYAYCGAEFLPDAIHKLHQDKLEWFWLFNINHLGSCPRMWSKHLMVSSKPVLVFTRGRVPQDDLQWCATDCDSERADKKWHEWGQSELFPAKTIISRTHEGDMVLDPFLGGGTVAWVAHKLGRKCIGIEISEKYCEIAVKRLAQEVMSFPHSP